MAGAPSGETEVPGGIQLSTADGAFERPRTQPLAAQKRIPRFSATSTRRISSRRWVQEVYQS